MGIELEAVAPCAHYDAQGIRHDHAPGDRFTVYEGGGFTAAHTSNVLITQGLAKAIPPKAKPKAAR